MVILALGETLPLPLQAWPRVDDENDEGEPQPDPYWAQVDHYGHGLQVGLKQCW